MKKTKEERLAKQAEWYQKNKERILKNNKNKVRQLAIKKCKLLGNLQCPLVKARKKALTKRNHYQKNKKLISERSKKWRENNLQKARENTAQRARERRKEEIQYKIIGNIRCRINHAVRGITKKSARTSDLIGCSFIDLKKYLELKFTPRMSWNNYGPKGWHIDHVIPLSSFDLTKEEELKKACHYSNLQPLWWDDNIRKSNKVYEKKN